MTKTKRKPGSRLNASLKYKKASPAQREKFLNKLKKEHPEVFQKKFVGGIIDRLWSSLDAIGEAGKADYGAVNKYGELKNPTKNTVGGVIGAVIDPLSFITDLINNESFINAKSRGEAEGAKNRFLEKEGKAQEQSRINKSVAQVQLNQRAKGLNKGGVVTGKSGKDKNAALLKEKSFVIPEESVTDKIWNIAGKVGLTKPLKKARGGNVPVLLTKGEIVIPPEKKSVFEALLKKQGISSLASLAPDAKPGNKKQTGGIVEQWRKRREELISLSEAGTIGEEEEKELKILGNKIAKRAQYEREEIKSKGTLKKLPEYIKKNPRNTKAEKKKFRKEKRGEGHEYLAEQILGGVQTTLGTALAGSSGKAPILDPELERSLKEGHKPINTQLGLDILGKQATYGMDPKGKSRLKGKIQEDFAESLALSTDISKSPTEAFNRISVLTKNKMRASQNLEFKDAELKEGKKTRHAGALIQSDPFLASLKDKKDRNRLILASQKQKLWDKEQDAYASLIGAGMQNTFGAYRTNRFWEQYREYGDPYRDSIPNTA